MTNLRAPFSFVLVVLLLFSNFLIVSASSKTAPEKIWSKELNGQPLFDLAINNDGELIAGRYSIIDGVYHNDYMTINRSNGNILNEWQGTGDSGTLTDNKGNVYIYTYNDETTKFTVYTDQGKKLWEKDLELDRGYFTIYSEDNNIIVDDNINGKFTFSFNGTELGREAATLHGDGYYNLESDGNGNL